MKLFTPPKTEYTDYYEVSKFNLIWNFSMSIFLLLILVTISNYSNDNYSSIPNLIAVLICALVMFFLYKTKKFKAVAIGAVISILILISLTFFFQRNVIHYTTPMWMLLNILLSFFILGRNWGTLVFIVHYVVLFFYFSFHLKSNLEGLPELKNGDIWNFIIESAIVGAGIFYILIEYIKTTKHAENDLKAVNDSLIDKNSLISEQNEEKEVMLKEIHHRVKNNLQIITSILRLQSHDIQDEKVIAPFKEAINRVSSISLIHEKMYQTDTISKFDLEDYFNSLSINIIANYAYKKEILINVQSSVTMIHSKSIVPIAMLYNELITNSVKHAFINVEQPKITVTFNPIDNEYFQMIYTDNGKWKSNVNTSFGTELIQAMTEQLDGHYAIDKTDLGTSYSFTFKILED
ncbi:MAG: hypothetical protein KC454_07955 [Flavobacteriales bacterium]|nr:hypothetical protein [Flavobacteriales bacterium]